MIANIGVTRTSSHDQLIERFLGGDPTAGTQALQELLALGDAGEEALFSQSIAFPKTVQVRRRWLRYVASRESSIVGRLIDRMQSQDRFHDAYVAAYLLAGLSDNRVALNALYTQLNTGANYYEQMDRFIAWGYAGGDASTLWHFVSESSFMWEKLRIFAFRGSCYAFARMNARDCRAIEQLITHEWPDHKLQEISNTPDTVISHQAVDSAELWLQANDPFMTWRRGEVADEILRRWSRHDHWRVREFGAQILASLGFQRTVTPVIEWLRWEPVQTVRGSLLQALERSGTARGADALIEHFNSSSQEGQFYLAKAAWRASDKNDALAVLYAVAHDEGAAGAEAVVSLARMGQRYAELSEMLDSHDDYRRLNAGLALAYLDDKSALDQLVAMQHEAATPFERIFLAAALAMLGKPNGAVGLNAEIVEAASAQDYEKRVDLFFVHRYLQTAVLDGLKTGGAQNALHAWRAEFEPLDPMPQPVVLEPGTVPIGQPSQALSPSSVKPAKPERDIPMQEQYQEQYIDFDLHIAPNGHAVASSAEGQATAQISLEVSNSMELVLNLIQARQANAKLLKQVGEELYDWLFPGPIHTHFYVTEAVARRENSKMRLRLRIEAEKIASLPLEFLYREIGGYFMAINPNTVLSRYLNLPLPPGRVRRRDGPLHMLAIIADPTDQTRLPPDHWEAIIKDALAGAFSK